MIRSIFTFFTLILLIFNINTNSFSQSTSYQYTNKNLPCVDKIYTIYPHIIKDSFGVSGISIEQINQVVKDANKYFEPICVSFKVCDYSEYIYYQYDTLVPSQYTQMVSHFQKDNRLNLYLVSNQQVVFIIPTVPACGFAGGTTTVIEKGCFAASTLAHELGHIFGLSHTFAGGDELVNGSNCATSGDFICDTPADPYDPHISLNQFINSKCLFTGKMKDANGQYYSPDVGNIMSYYPCVCGFSAEQLRKIADLAMNNFKKLW